MASRRLALTVAVLALPALAACSSKSESKPGGGGRIPALVARLGLGEEFGISPRDVVRPDGRECAAGA